MARRPARLVVTLLLAIGAVAGAGCGAVTELIQLEERIERQGYDVTGVFHDDFGTGRNEVQVDASTGRGVAPPRGNEEIAGIVWDSYPRRFDRVSVTLDGVDIVFTRSQLQERFGARDATLDEKEFQDEIEAGIRTAFIAGAIALLVIVAVIITVVVLVRRRRRNLPPPTGPPFQPYQPYPYGGAQPPPPPAGPPPGWYPPPPAPQPPAAPPPPTAPTDTPPPPPPPASPPPT